MIRIKQSSAALVADIARMFVVRNGAATELVHT